MAIVFQFLHFVTNTHILWQLWAAQQPWDSGPCLNMLPKPRVPSHSWVSGKLSPPLKFKQSLPCRVESPSLPGIFEELKDYWNTWLLLIKSPSLLSLSSCSGFLPCPTITHTPHFKFPCNHSHEAFRKVTEAADRDRTKHYTSQRNCRLPPPMCFSGHCCFPTSSPEHTGKFRFPLPPGPGSSYSRTS